MKKAVIYLTLLSVLLLWLPAGVFAGNSKHLSKHKFRWWPWNEVYLQLDSQQKQLDSYQDWLTSLDVEIDEIWKVINTDKGGSTPATQYASFHVSVDNNQIITIIYSNIDYRAQ